MHPSTFSDAGSFFQLLKLWLLLAEDLSRMFRPYKQGAQRETTINQNCAQTSTHNLRMSCYVCNYYAHLHAFFCIGNTFDVAVEFLRIYF